MLAAVDVCLIARNYFLREGVRLGLDKEIAPDGTYLAYFPFGAMIERSRITPYHKKLKVGKRWKEHHQLLHQLRLIVVLAEYEDNVVIASDTTENLWNTLAIDRY